MLKKHREDSKIANPKRRSLVAALFGLTGGALFSIIPRRADAIINIPPEVAQGTVDGFHTSFRDFFEKWRKWMVEQPKDKAKKEIPAIGISGQAVIETIKDIYDARTARKVLPKADPCNDAANSAATDALEKSANKQKIIVANNRIANVRNGIL